MRILFFTNEYSHPELPAAGGVGTFFKTISKRLIAEGHDVFIYGFSKKKYKVNDDGIQIEFFKQYFKKFPITDLTRSISTKIKGNKAARYWLKKERQFYAKQLKEFSNENKIDLIQSFTFNGFTAYWDNSIPLITRFHGSLGFWQFYLDHTGSELKIEMEKKALQVTPFTVANSYFSADFIKQFYGVGVDTVIQNGIDTSVFSPKPNIEVFEKSIFYVGTLSTAKGVDTLARVFNEIIKIEPDATLHLMGKNEKYWNFLKTEIFSEAALEKTKYYGHVALQEIPNKLAQATVVAVPTKGETFGFTIVEAMAMEKVTIVSKIPVAEEIIENGKDGLVAENETDFAEKILNVFKNPKAFEEMRKQARLKVLENFSQEIMASKHIEYYKQILSKK